MSRLPELEVFVAVVDHASFTAAAESLAVSKSFVSKQISGLEDRLGVRLLNRTTRKLALTDAGRAFYERAAQIVIEIEEAERSVMQLNTSPRGVLRLSAPMSFGLDFLSPLLANFLCEFPDLSLDMELSDRHVDVIEEGYDLAIRIGQLADSSFIARKLAPVELVFCASPAYLKAHGTPTRARELTAHQCMQYTYQASATTWRLTSPLGKEHTVPVNGRFRANNGTALLEAARQGVGIALLPDFIAAGDLRNGNLTQILEDWQVGERAIWALYPHNRHLSAKVRACVDYLAEHLNPAPWLCAD